jgi:hypothetical protein
MLPMKAIFPAILVMASLPAGAAADSRLSTCPESLLLAVVDARIGNPRECSGKNATFLLAGRTTGSGYSIYDYRYRFLPHPGGVMHGGQRLLVFHGREYLGQYAVQPDVKVTVRGTRVFLQVEDNPRDRATMDFSRAPPKRVLINGELVSFWR